MCVNVCERAGMCFQECTCIYSEQGKPPLAGPIKLASGGFLLFTLVFICTRGRR